MFTNPPFSMSAPKFAPGAHASHCNDVLGCQGGRTQGVVFVSTHAPVCSKALTGGVVAQAVGNPVPRVPHPDWLLKRLSAATDARKQRRISSMFAAKAPKRGGGCGGDGGGGSDGDMEDLGVAQPAAAAGRGRAVARKKQRQIQLRTIVRRPSATLPFCFAAR